MAVGGRWVSGRVKTGRPCCARGDDVFGACAPLSPDGDSFARNKRKSSALICLKPGVRIFFWTILVVLTLSLSFLCILLDSCRPR